MRKLLKFVDNAIWTAWFNRPVITTHHKRFDAIDAAHIQGFQEGRDRGLAQAEEMCHLLAEIGAKVQNGIITGDDIRFALQITGG